MTTIEAHEAYKARLLDRVVWMGEAARLLGVCPATVRRYVRRGRLKCFRGPGDKRRFYLSELRRFIEHRAEVAANAH